MQRKFINNLLFVVVLNLLVKPFWILGIDRTVQNVVGETEYGFYYPIFSFAIILNIILDLGITNYNNRNIAQHSQMLSRYFSGIFNVKLILGLIYLAATLIFGLVIGYHGKEIYLLLVLCLNQFLSSLILYLRSNLAGLHLFKSDGIVSVIDRVIMIAICSVLLWGGVVDNFKIEWFVYSQTVAYLITGLFAFIMVLRKAKFFKFKIDLKLFRIVIKESLPFAILVLLMSFYYRLDSVMIERMLGNGKFEVGIYAKSYRLLEGFNMFGYLFAGLLLPIFSRMLKKKESVDKLVKTSFNLIFLPTIVVSIISYIYSVEIMDLLYDTNIQKSAKVFQVLMFSFIATALSYVYGTLLTANGSLKSLNIISLIGLILNLGLNYMLIPLYGAYGAAYATLLTQGVVIFAQIVVAKKILSMDYEISVFVKNTVVLVLGLMIVYFIYEYNKTWYLSAFLMMLSFLILAIIFRIFKVSDLKQILKSN
jgi:O-antigen/teichoic acid export membrane protein